MAKDDFSKIRPGRSEAPPPSQHSVAESDGNSHRGGASLVRRRLSWLGLVVVVVAAVVVAVALISGSGGGSHSTSSAPPFGTAHGPTRFEGGIPSGYTHDRGGAATAAVNFVQALSRVTPGQVDQLAKSFLGANPSASLTAQLANARKPQTGTEKSDVLNAIPATVTVRSLTEQSAQVSVWTMAADDLVLNATGQKSMQLIWSTTDLTLVWQSGDWRAVDMNYHTGPDPSDASAPTTDAPGVETGYFSFFVN